MFLYSDHYNEKGSSLISIAKKVAQNLTFSFEDYSYSYEIKEAASEALYARFDNLVKSTPSPRITVSAFHPTRHYFRVREDEK